MCRKKFCPHKKLSADNLIKNGADRSEKRRVWISRHVKTLVCFKPFWSTKILLPERKTMIFTVFFNTSRKTYIETLKEISVSSYRETRVSTFIWVKFPNISGFLMHQDSIAGTNQTDSHSTQDYSNFPKFSIATFAKEIKIVVIEKPGLDFRGLSLFTAFWSFRNFMILTSRLLIFSTPKRKSIALKSITPVKNGRNRDIEGRKHVSSFGEIWIKILAKLQN